MSYQFIQTYSIFWALLALIAAGLAIAGVVYRVMAGREAALRIGQTRAIWAAWAIATAATIGSLLYSEWLGFTPCRLCWFQRIAMYPMAVILAVGAWRRDVAVKLYALPLAVTGLGISIYHYIIQTWPNLEAGGSCDAAVPCTARLVEVFGFISIPAMAAAGFAAITVLLAFYTSSQTAESAVETTDAETVDAIERGATA